MNFLARSVMSSQLITISEGKNISQAEEVMAINKIRHLPVVDSFNELSGILSSTDVARALNKNVEIKEVMSPRVRIIKRDENLKKIIPQMLKFKISSMLVSHNEELVGIVTTDDLIQLLYELIDEDENLQNLEVSNLIESDWQVDEDDLRTVDVETETETEIQ